MRAIMIDKEIAEKVMGWRECPLSGSCSPDIDSIYVVPNALIEYKGQHTDRIINFHPSTNISDAWMVVERLKELDRMIDISTLDDREYENYQCTVWNECCNDNVFIKDISAPMAICLAALEVIKVMDDE